MNRAEIVRILEMAWTQEAYLKELAQHYICQIEEEIGDVLHRCQRELRQVKKTWAPPPDAGYAVLIPQVRLWQIDLHDWVSYKKSREERETPEGEDNRSREERETPEGEDNRSREERETPEGEDNRSREERRTPAGEALYNKVWEVVNANLSEEERQELQKWNKWEKYLTNIHHYFIDGNPEEEATYPFLHTMTLVLIYLFLGTWYPTTEMKALSNDAGGTDDNNNAEPPSDTFNQLRNASGNAQWVEEAFNIAREHGWLEGDTPPFRWKAQQQALCYFIACAFNQDLKWGMPEARKYGKLFGFNTDVEKVRRALKQHSRKVSKEYPLAAVRLGTANAPESIQDVVNALTHA